MKNICIIKNSNINNSKKYFNITIQKSQRVKTWELAFTFILRKKYVEFYKNDSTQYAIKMTEFGKWTETRLIDLGPTFIKLGQLLSTRRDIFPSEFVERS